MEKFTEENLKQSQLYKDYITGKVALIHNVYYDSKVDYNTFIVVSDETDYKHTDVKWQDVSKSEFKEMNTKINGSWSITRFFMGGGKLHVSIDHSDCSTEEVFKLLLSDYSSGLTL